MGLKLVDDYEPAVHYLLARRVFFFFDVDVTSALKAESRLIQPQHRISPPPPDLHLHLPFTSLPSSHAQLAIS